jgi:hypothetical protein
MSLLAYVARRTNMRVGARGGSCEEDMRANMTFLNHKPQLDRSGALEGGDV